MLPIFEERIPVERYRLSGGGRLVAYAVLLALNWLGLAVTSRLALDRAVYLRFVATNTVILALAASLAALAWRGRYPVSVLRRLTFGCILMEGLSTVLLLWLGDFAFSFVLPLGILLVLGTRVFFDFAAGALAVVVLGGGIWAYNVAEALGLLPLAPLLLDPPPPPFDEWPVRFLAVAVYTAALLLTFVVATLVVAQVRRRDRALFMLRDDFVIAGVGGLGRHSGRTLRDTWLLGRVIGRGGMGEVYQGIHGMTGRAVAVKVLLPHLLEDETVLERFRREAEITASLGSRHIVQVVDIDQDEGVPFIVYELLGGESLASRIARCGRLPADQVAHVIAQAASGLAEAHRVGVVHRDLKPANIFLVPEGEAEVVKVLDFGVSKMLGQMTVLTQELGVLGTPAFMAPEQAWGGKVNARTDVYALGAIAYACLGGVPPFHASSVPATLHRVCTEEPVPLDRMCPAISADVQAVVAIAMAKRPVERYPSVVELARDLAAAVAGALPVEVRRRARLLTRGAPPSVSESRLEWLMRADTERIGISVKAGRAGEKGSGDAKRTPSPPG